MPPAHTRGSLAADFEILEAIGRNVDELIERFVPVAAVQKTMRRWLLGHAEPPENREALLWLMTMAADLELFTPSASGRTLIDRHLNRNPPPSQLERAAREALAAAEFRLVRIIGREGPDVVILKDLVSQEGLRLLDARIDAEATGLTSAMRLCPLASGRHVLITPLFALDQETLAAAIKFARPGQPLSYRCAASLYRDLARRGFLPIPLTKLTLDAKTLQNALSENAAELSEVEHLAMHWICEEEEMEDLVLDARQLASVDNLVDACGLYGQTGPDAPAGLKAAFERIADLQVETLVQRARAGVHGQANSLDAAAEVIASYLARGNMAAGAQELFQRLRLRWTLSSARASASSYASSALSSVGTSLI